MYGKNIAPWFYFNTTQYLGTMGNLNMTPLPFIACLLLVMPAFTQTVIPDTTLSEAVSIFEEGSLHFTNSDWAAAAESWRKTTIIAPEMADAWYNLALAYYQMDDFLETEKHLEKVFAADPFHVDAYELLGMALYQRGEYGRAIKAFNYVINEKPSNELRLTKSICYIAYGETQVCPSGFGRYTT